MNIQNNPSAKSAKSVVAVVVGLLLAVALIVVTILVNGTFDNSAKATDSTETTQSESVRIKPTNSNTENCEYPVSQWKDGANYEMIEGFYKTVPLAVKTASGEKLTNEARAEYVNALLDGAAENPVLLASYAYAVNLWDSPQNIEPLIEGKCLSSKGVKTLSKLEGALMANGVDFTSGIENAEVMYNSGVVDGKYSVSDAPGAFGYEHGGVTITFANGSKLYALNYCGNVMWPNTPPPSVPVNPKVPSPPKPKPKPECPPGTTGNGVNCKDLVANDSYYQDSAPIGGGWNIQSGPGQRYTPEQMVQSGPDPYVAPAQPAPTPPNTGGGNTGSGGSAPVVDPTPPPPAEPPAPTPVNPVTPDEGSGCLPGMC